MPLSIETHRVPDLELDLFAVYVDHPCPEFNPNSQVMYRLKPFVSKLKQKA